MSSFPKLAGLVEQLSAQTRTMSGYSFRSPVQNLAEFLRSLAVPRSAYGSGGGTTSTDVDAYEWAALRARQGGTKRLDFHDHDLRGPDGAVTVLRAMERSPAVTAITLFVQVLRSQQTLMFVP